MLFQMRYLDTCPKNDTISFSRKGLCFRVKVKVRIRVRVELRLEDIIFFAYIQNKRFRHFQKK